MNQFFLLSVSLLASPFGVLRCRNRAKTCVCVRNYGFVAAANLWNLDRTLLGVEILAWISVGQMFARNEDDLDSGLRSTKPKNLDTIMIFSRLLGATYWPVVGGGEMVFVVVISLARSLVRALACSIGLHSAADRMRFCLRFGRFVLELFVRARLLEKAASSRRFELAPSDSLPNIIIPLAPFRLATKFQLATLPLAASERDCSSRATSCESTT